MNNTVTNLGSLLPYLAFEVNGFRPPSAEAIRPKHIPDNFYTVENLHIAIPSDYKIL